MRPRSSHVALFVLIAGFFAARIPLIPRRRFDPDEFEHAHDAWLMWKGMVPYKDFFEHHTPWYYYALRPFYNWIQVDASFENAYRFLMAARGLSFVLTALATFLVYRIGRRWQDTRTGLVAALFFVAQPVVLQKTIEMRPDMLALPFFLGGLLLLLRGLERGPDSAAPGLRPFIAAGLAVGGAIMCTQKMMFVLPGALAGLAIWAARGGRADAPRRILAILVFLAGIAVPFALTWVAFAAQHAGREFVFNNFIVNAHWKHFETHMWDEVYDTSKPLFFVALAGPLLSLFAILRMRERRDGDVLLLCTGWGVFAGLPVVPVAQRQYYLMLFPIVCLWAAQALRWGVEHLPERLRPVLFGLALFGLLWKPVRGVNDEAHRRNDDQLAKLRTVFERTQPTDMVMDGWQGMGVFRPHAFHYFFLHEEVRAWLPQTPVDALLGDLESGSVRPKLIAMDDNLRALGPRFVSFVETHYTSSDGFFYFANGQAGPSP
jgi:4-amino-4-deoxy-L-arabinose transferase-like glycosyltransferase